MFDFFGTLVYAQHLLSTLSSPCFGVKTVNMVTTGTGECFHINYLRQPIERNNLTKI
jgi:hypothetical protein